MPKSESRVPSRKPSRNQEEIAQAVKQAIILNQKREINKEFLNPNQNFADLAIIREEDKLSSKVGSQNKLSTENEKLANEPEITQPTKNGVSSSNGADANKSEQPPPHINVQILLLLTEILVQTVSRECSN